MKLKLVALSMSVLGLISCPPVFAAHAKHKHHHKRHHQVVHHVAAPHDYKDMGSLPVQPVPMEPACMISQTSMILDEANQNMGRAIPTGCNPGWFNRIAIAGGMNIDLGKWGNRNSSYMGVNYQRLSLNDAYLNIAANVNDWTKAFASLSFNTATSNTAGTFGVGEYSSAYSNNVTGAANNSLQLEQAYVTLANFDQSPIFVQVGKQFQDFSRYEIHPITRSLTQVMSETLATSAKIGFIVPMGFQGALFAFDDPLPKLGQTSRPTNYGMSLGFDQPNDQMGWDLGASYLYDMIGVNDVAYAVRSFTHTTGYNTRVGGVALYGDVNSGPFALGARYTVATQSFNPADLPQNGRADTTGVGAAAVVNATASGAKPWAAGIQASFGYDGWGWGKNHNVYVGYQASRQAAGLNLPKNRVLVGYALDMYKYTTLGLEWDHDNAYNTGNGGTGNNANLFSFRAGVKFG